jgi:hypothetical protein
MPIMDGPTASRAIRDLGYTAPIFGKFNMSLYDVYMYMCIYMYAYYGWTYSL